MRRVYVSFCRSYIDNYVYGVQGARSDISSARYEIDGACNNTYDRCDLAKRRIDEGIVKMGDDARLARDVLRNNEDALNRIVEDIQRLEQYAIQLQQAYSRAYEEYRAACREQTRINNSPPSSTGDSEADAQAKKAWAQEKDAAARLVRQTDHACYEIKQEQAQTQRRIQELHRLKEDVIRINNELRSFIQITENNIGQFRMAQGRIREGENRLKKEQERFHSLCTDVDRNLGNCIERGEAASGYVYEICKALAPDHNPSAYLDSTVTFHDLDALDDTAKALDRTCHSCEDKSEHLTHQMRGHQKVMQDAIIANAVAIMGEEQSDLLARMGFLREQSQNCKNASVSLYNYYNLAP